MTSKFLQISSGQNLPPTRYEIVQVEKNTYMLKNIDSHVGLLGTLQNLLQTNNLMQESYYSDLLWKRSRSMIKAAYKADNFFIGCGTVPAQNNLLQWSVSQGKVVQDCYDITAGHIKSMVQTSDKIYLFLSDSYGY